MSDDECPHDRTRPDPEVADNGLLTGRCNVVCDRCDATLFRDNRSLKKAAFYKMADDAGDPPPLVPRRKP